MSGGPRPRRRGAELEAAILDAVLEELRELGYAAMTVEGVARRAGAGKYSLYKRWPSKAALAVAAAYHLKHAGPSASTGQIREDLFLWLRRIADLMEGPMGEIFRGVLSESLASAGQPGFSLLSRKAGLEDLRHILATARERGVAIPEDLPDPRLEAPQALLTIHFLTHGTPIVDDTLRSIVDQVALPLFLRDPATDRPDG